MTVKQYINCSLSKQDVIYANMNKRWLCHDDDLIKTSCRRGKRKEIILNLMFGELFTLRIT